MIYLFIRVIFKGSRFIKIVWFMFEECNYGFFGQNCASQCFNTCKGCNNVDGACDRGCYPGWQGNNCGDCNYYYIY